MLIALLAFPLLPLLQASLILTTTESEPLNCSQGRLCQFDPQICEYGYFPHLSTYCVPCPHRQSFECMDCLENPNSWDQTRTCTYLYHQINKDPDAAYITKYLPNPELYFVLQTAPFTQQTLICEGCLRFCDPFFDDNCNAFKQPLDQNKGVICQNGYFYSNDNCELCPQNCQHCGSSSECFQCFDGYVLSLVERSCIKCFDNCSKCELDLSGEMICLECLSAQGGPILIPSLTMKECESCHPSCARCEYISYSAFPKYQTRDQLPVEGIGYRQRCRKCVQPRAFVVATGDKCMQCTIPNCLQCFQTISDSSTTMDPDFIPLNHEAIGSANGPFCAICKDGFKVSSDQLFCTANSQSNNCATYGKDGQCLACQGEYIFDYDLKSCSTTEVCFQKISNCKKCQLYLVTLLDEDDAGNPISLKVPKYRCLRCEEKFYPSLVTGDCVKCQLQCQECWEYSLSYNITEAASYNRGISQNDVQKIQNEVVEGLACSKCDHGFEIYQDQCRGCTSDCTYNSLNMCRFDIDQAYCQKCQNPKVQQSLSDDLSQCEECPTNCIACRTRSHREIEIINPVFNPTSLQLKKYSKVCYKARSASGSHIYIDSELLIPVQCSGRKYCQNTAQLTVKLDCLGELGEEESVLRLSQIFSGKSKTATLLLKNIETFENYLLLNSKVVSQLDINIELVGTECKFSKPTIFKSYFKQNVFPLKKLRVRFKGQELTTFKQFGPLDFGDIDELSFVNIKFEFDFELEAQHKSYGVNYFSKSGNLVLENVHVFKSEVKVSQFSFTATNLISASLKSVELDRMGPRDAVFNFTGAQSFYRLSVTGLLISNSIFQNRPLFNIMLSQSNQINLLNLKFKECIFQNSSILTALSFSGSASLVINKLTFLFSYFNFSNLINSKQLNSFSLQSVDLVYCRFNYSAFITTSIIRIRNFYSQRSLLVNESVLIQTTDEKIEGSFVKFLTAIQIEKFKAKETQCGNRNCLLKLSSPENSQNLLFDIQLQDITLFNTQINHEEYSFVTSALITVQQAKDVYISNLQSIGNLASSILFCDVIKSVQIARAEFIWGISSEVMFPDVEELAELSITPFKQYKNPINNKIPLTQDCAQEKAKRLSYNGVCIFITRFSHGVKLQDIVLESLLFIDQPAILIESYEVEIFHTSRAVDKQSLLFYAPYESEVITVENCRFFNNTLLTQQSSRQISLISIFSEQRQLISVNLLDLQSTHLHGTVLDQSCVSSAGLLVISPLASVRLENSNFEHNRATNQQFGLLYFQVRALEISRSSFLFTNIVDPVWYNRLNKNKASGDLKEGFFNVFQVTSLGANIYVITRELMLRDARFNQSSGGGGASFYMVSSAEAKINIESSIFEAQNASLNQPTQGGALYVDSSEFSLALSISKSVMRNCQSRTRGGCIMLQAAKKHVNVIIEDSIFEGCQSLSGSFMVASLSSSTPGQVQLTRITILRNNMEELLESLGSLQIQEKIELASHGATYQQIYGTLRIEDSSVSQIKICGLFYLEQIHKVAFNRLNIFENAPLLVPLIAIKSFDYHLGQLNFGEVKFSKNADYYFKQTGNACEANVTQGKDNLQEDCDEMNQIYPLQLELFLDDDFQVEVLYDEEDQEEYNNLSEDDRYGFLSKIRGPVSSVPQIDIDLEVKRDLRQLQCSLNELWQQQDIALMLISSLSSFNKIDFQGVTISSNNCSRCFGGLVQIKSIPSFEALIELKQISCIKNIGGYYGCLRLTSMDSFQEVSPFQSILAKRLLQKHYAQISAMLIDSYFKGNLARAGASVSFINVSAQVQNCYFASNQATLLGGAIYFQDSTGFNRLFVMKSYFHSNQAQIGAALYLENSTLSQSQSDGNYFESNVASISAANILEVTRKQSLTLDGVSVLAVRPYNNRTGDSDLDGIVDSAQSAIEDEVVVPQAKYGNYPELTNYLILPSGQPLSRYKYFYEYTMEQVSYNWSPRIVNVNQFGEIIVNERKGATCQVQGRLQSEKQYNPDSEFTSRFTNLKEIIYDPAKGGYDLDDFFVIMDPYGDRDNFLELKVTCHSVKLPTLITEQYNSNYALILKVKTFPCQLGEAYNQNMCLACAGKTFNLVPKKGICQELNQEIMLDSNRIGVRLKNGWWRPRFDNDRFAYCLNRPVNCKGGWIPGNPSCEVGHIGALCESCDIHQIKNSEKYANIEKYQCGACSGSLGDNIRVFISTTLVTVGSIALSVKGTQETVKSFLILKVLVLLGVRIKLILNNLATFIKILTNYFQIIQILFTFQLVVPKWIHQGTEVLGNPSKSSSYSMDCLLVDLSAVDILYFKMIWATIMPFIYLSIFFCQYFFGVLLGKFPYKTAMITTAFIYMFIYTQPTLLQGFISLASKKNISGIGWVQSDLAYEYTTSHVTWVLSFAMPMIILLALFLPFMFFYKIWQQRDILENRFVRSRWGFFYNEYSIEDYYWEFVKILLKQLMSMFLIFYEDFVIIKGSLIVILLMLYFWLQIYVQPYTINSLNIADQYSTFVCAITLALGVLAYRTQTLSLDYLLYIVYVIAILINLMYLIFMITLLIDGYLYKLKDKADQVRDIINSQYPLLGFKFPSFKRFLIHRGRMEKRVNQLWGVFKVYTKEQMKNSREKLPKYEQILNAPFDLKAAKQGKHNTATVYPQDDDDALAFLNSNNANTLKQMINQIDSKDVKSHLDNLTDQVVQEQKSFFGGMLQQVIGGDVKGFIQDKVKGAIPNELQTFFQSDKSQKANNSNQVENPKGGLFDQIQSFTQESNSQKKPQDLAEAKNAKNTVNQEQSMFGSLIGGITGGKSVTQMLEEKAKSLIPQSRQVVTGGNGQEEQSNSMFGGFMSSLTSGKNPTELIKDQLQSVLPGAKNPAELIKDQFSSSLVGENNPADVIKNQLQSAFTGAKSPVDFIKDQVLSVVPGDKNPTDLIKDQLQSVLPGGQNPADLLKDQLKSAFNGDISIADRVKDKLQTVVPVNLAPPPSGESQVEKLKTIAGQIDPSGFFAQVQQLPLQETEPGKVQQVAENQQNESSSIFSGVGGFFQNVASGRGLTELVGEKMQNVVPKNLQSALSMKDQVLSDLNQAGSVAQQAGKLSIIGNFVDGISDLKSQVQGLLPDGLQDIAKVSEGKISQFQDTLSKNPNDLLKNIIPTNVQDKLSEVNELKNIGSLIPAELRAVGEHVKNQVPIQEVEGFQAQFSEFNEEKIDFLQDAQKMEILQRAGQDFQDKANKKKLMEDKQSIFKSFIPTKPLLNQGRGFDQQQKEAQDQNSIIDFNEIRKGRERDGIERADNLSDLEKSQKQQNSQNMFHEIYDL